MSGYPLRNAAGASFAIALLLVACGRGEATHLATSEGTTPTTTPSSTTTSTTTAGRPAACPTEAELAARAHTRARTVDTTEPESSGPGLRVEPPPAGATARISEDQALRRAGAYNGGAAPDPGPDPTITLASFSDDTGMMRLNPDGTRTKLIQDRLSWVILARHATIGRATGGPAAPGTPTTAAPSCTLGTVVTAVDAHTGDVLLLQTLGDDIG